MGCCEPNITVLCITYVMSSYHTWSIYHMDLMQVACYLEMIMKISFCKSNKNFNSFRHEDFFSICFNENLRFFLSLLSFSLPYLDF